MNPDGTENDNLKLGVSLEQFLDNPIKPVRFSFGVTRKRGGEHLERQIALQLRVVGAVNPAQAALADVGENFAKS